MLPRLVLVALCISSPPARAEDDVCTGLEASEPCPSSVLIQSNQLFRSSSQSEGINPFEDFGFPLWSSESETDGEAKKSQTTLSEDAALAPKKERQEIHSFTAHVAKGKKVSENKVNGKKADDKKADGKKAEDKKANGRKADDMKMKELETMKEENSMFAFMDDSVQASLLDLTAQHGAQPGAQPGAPEGSPEEQLPNDEDNKDLNVDGLKRVAQTKDTDQCFSFLLRLTEAMGLEPKGTKGDDFLYKLAKEYASKGKADPFDTLVRKLLDSPDLKPCIIVKDGTEAPLSQNGYRGVVQQHSDAQMQKYMQRLAESMDLKVTNKGGLAGSSAWYSGRKAVQSLAKLRAELLAESRKKHGWIKPNDKKKEESFLAVMDGVTIHSQSSREASQLNAPKREHVISTKASGTILTSKQPGNVSKSNASAKVKATVTNASNASSTTLKKARTKSSGASGWKFNTTKRKGANANQTDKNAQTDDLPDTAEEIARSLHTESSKNHTGSSANASIASNQSATSTKNSSKDSATKREGKATGARHSTESKQADTKTAGKVKVVARVKTTSNSTNKTATATNSTTKAKVTTTSNSTNKTATATNATTKANKTAVNSTATKKSAAGTAPKKTTTIAAKTNTTANSSATVNATAASKTASAPKAKSNTTSANSSKTANGTKAKAGNATSAKVTTAVKKTNATSTSATKKKANATGAGKANQTGSLKSNKTVTNTTVAAKKNTIVSATKKGANATGAGKASQTTLKSNKTVTNTTVAAKKNSTAVGKSTSGATVKTNATTTQKTPATKKNSTASATKKEANATGAGTANKTTTQKANKSAASTTAAVKTKSGNKGKENIIGHVETPKRLTVKADTDTATDAVPKEHPQYSFKSFSQGVYKRVAKNSNKEEMYSFINQTMTSMGLTEEKEGFLETLAEEKSKAKDPGSFSELVVTLRDAKGKGLKSTCIEKNGYVAPFSENGYRCVVQMQDDEQMLAYTKRLATEMGLEVNTESGAQEQMPFYSGKLSVQSLAKLREELRKQSSMPNGWATRTGLTNTTMDMNDGNSTMASPDDMEVGTPPPIAA